MEPLEARRARIRANYWKNRDHVIAKQREWHRSIGGIATTTFKAMVRNSKIRGHSKPDFKTREELLEWLLKQPNLDVLMVAYRESGFDRFSRPSVDRLDNSKGYHLDNIRLVSWRENLKAWTDSPAHRSVSGYRFHKNKKPLKTHCKGGHEYTQENTIKRAKSGRICRACIKIYNARHYSKMKEVENG